MIITLEGIDGCGKSTAAKKLVERFAADGRSAVVFPAPGPDLREYLAKTGHELGKATKVMLYLADMVDRLERRTVPALKRGNVVIWDRSAASTIVYQEMHKRDAHTSALHEQATRLGFVLEAINALHPELDFTEYLFLLRVSPKTAMARSAGHADDEYERAEPGVWKTRTVLYEGLFSRAAEYDNISIMDVERQNADQVADAIYEKVRHAV